MFSKSLTYLPVFFNRIQKWVCIHTPMEVWSSPDMGKPNPTFNSTFYIKVPVTFPHKNAMTSKFLIVIDNFWPCDICKSIHSNTKNMHKRFNLPLFVVGFYLVCLFRGCCKPPSLGFSENSVNPQPSGLTLYSPIFGDHFGAHQILRQTPNDIILAIYIYIYTRTSHSIWSR